VTDQLERKVDIPVKVSRVVILQHQTLDIAIELGAGDKIVGVLKSWPVLIPGLDRLYPPLESLATPGDLTEVNVEDLLRLHADVVFTTNFAPPAMIQKITAAGLPVIEVSLAKGEGLPQAKLNPSFSDDDRAYAEGLRDGIELIGDVLGKHARAQALIDAAFAGRRLVEERIKGIPDSQRVRLYMANPNLMTYGAGKYTGVMMARSGGVNVAREIRGAKQVSMENVLEWNPQVIFVQDRFAAVADQIRNNAAWRTIDAVKVDRIYITPEYVKPWGYPLPEALALGELWMARKLYPERFRDVDMDARVDQYYRMFYGRPYAGSY
jgi:iron complex transport system substrate-binding protein